MPRLHRAKTVACGLLKWGKCVWIMVVHSVTRGWQDIRILLEVMGARQPPIPCPTEGGLVTSCTLSYRHFSKTYCKKPPTSPLSSGWRQGGRQEAPSPPRQDQPPRRPPPRVGPCP